MGVNFILQKLCQCKKNDNYKVCSLLHLRLWRYLPIFPINVRHRSLPDQIKCNRDHIQKHISFLSKEEEKNTFLTLLLFTSQSFQLMWDGDLFQIKSIAIQTTQIFKFDSSVLSNLTVRLRFIFVAWKICQGPMFFSSLFNVHTFCI